MAMDINYHPSNNGDINLQHMGASTNLPSENLGLQHFQVVSEVAPQLFQAGWDEGCHGMRLWNMWTTTRGMLKMGDPTNMRYVNG